MYTLCKHVKPLPRRFQFLPQVDTVGILHNKTYRIKFTFDTCNFSFILNGRGDYIYKGKHYKIKAPTMFIQYPGAELEYGPDHSWDELFFIFDATDFDFFHKLGFLDPENPVLELGRSAKLLKDVEILQDILAQPKPSADRIDLMCYYILQETMIRSSETALADSLIPQIRERLTSDFGSDFDLNRMAAEFGMSQSTLRRYWLKHHGPETFSEYRASCFLRESCRLLVETNHSIKQVSAELGLSDPYYFSRRFHELSGETPTEYRKRNSFSGKNGLELDKESLPTN